MPRTFMGIILTRFDVYAKRRALALPNEVTIMHGSPVNPAPHPCEFARAHPAALDGLDQIFGEPMPSVKVRENEPFEFALRRFKRTCEKAGVLAETRKREFYEKPTQERKRKAAAAVKRQLRRSSRDVTKRQRLY